MKRINVPNNTRMPIYVGSTMIPPGEMRQFDENDVPMHLRPKTPPAAPAKAPSEAEKKSAAEAEHQAKLSALARQPVGEIREQFATLSEQDLTALEAAEKAAEKPRKGLLEAIGAELLQRAQNASAGAP